MDSLTQIAIGIATVEVLAGDTLKNRSYLYGAILGTFPDLDVWFGYLFHPVDAVAMHRSLTHSFLGMLLFSPLLGFLLWKVEKGRISFLLANIIIASTIFTHVAIDLFTSWGVQILYPSTWRLSFKTIFVIDPLYTIPWIIALIIMWRKTGKSRKKILRRGFIWSSAYLLWTIIAKLIVMQHFKKELQNQNISYEQFIVKPTALNTILWQAQVKDGDTYYIGDYSFFDTKDVTWKSYKNDKKSEEIIAKDPRFSTLVDVVENWYTVEEKQGVYIMNDLRFGVMENEETNKEQFVFSYYFIPENENQAKFYISEAPKTTRDGRMLFKKLWKRLQGN